MAPRVRGCEEKVNLMGQKLWSLGNALTLADVLQPKRRPLGMYVPSR